MGFCALSPHDMRRRRCIETAFESDRLWAARLRRAYELVVPVVRRDVRPEVQEEEANRQSQPQVRAPKGGKVA
jgi:hypothetical protein